MVDFLVVKVPFAYNAILERPTLRMFEVLASTYYLMVKFPTDQGVGELRGDQVTARECYFNSVKYQGGLLQNLTVIASKAKLSRGR